jgi:hypothetical protein
MSGDGTEFDGEKFLPLTRKLAPGGRVAANLGLSDGKGRAMALIVRRGMAGEPGRRRLRGRESGLAVKRRVLRQPLGADGDGAAGVEPLQLALQVGLLLLGGLRRV